MFLRRLALTVLAGMSVAACGTPLAPERSLVVRLLGVTPGYPARVDFSVTNSSRQRMWLSRCGDRIMTTVDTAFGPGWQQFSGDGCLAVAPEWPLAIEPGATLESNRGVYAHGRFRLRIGAAADAEADYSWTPSSTGFEIP